MKKRIALAALAAVAVLVLLFIFLPVVAWIVVGLALLMLAVVLFVPIGADIGYMGGALSLAARVDGFTYQLLPKKPEDPNKPKREKKPKKEEKPQEPKEEKDAKPRSRKFDFTKEELLELAKKAIKGLGKFGRLTVRRFMLHYVAAGQDPYNSAMTYNYVNAALCLLAPLCAKSFRVAGDVDVKTDVDFTTEKMRLDFELSLTIRLAQAVHAGFAVAFGALGVLIRNKRRRKKEAKLAQLNGAAEPDEKDTDRTTDPENNQPEERNDLNG